MIDSIQDNTEIPADPQEERVPQTSTSVVAARSKAKAKPQPRGLVGTTATIPIHERRWIDIEPSKQNLASYDLSKKVINLLRHNQTWPGGWGPQGRRLTGGGGLARVPNLRVCEHLLIVGVAHAGEEG